MWAAAASPAVAGLNCTEPYCGEVINHSTLSESVSNNWCWGDNAPRFGDAALVNTCRAELAWLAPGASTQTGLSDRFNDTDAFRADAGCITKFRRGGIPPSYWPVGGDVRTEDRRGKSQHKWIKLSDSDEIEITYQSCGGTPGRYYINTWAKGFGYQDQWCYGNGGSGNAARCNSDGELYTGSNYVFCKVWGTQVGGPAAYNHYWLLTDLDYVYGGRDGRSFVSAYYLTGGPNNYNDSAYYYDSAWGQWRWIPTC